MLRTLRVRNLVLIEEATIDFGPGLNLLTGETGAGKSILLGALALISGARADRSAVRAGQRRATVEALVEPSADIGVGRWLEERGIGDGDNEQVLIHREISASGSGRVLVNGSPCTLSLLRELVDGLIELHGQHEQQSLRTPERHLALLDRFGGHQERLGRVRAAHAGVVDARTQVEGLREQAGERDRRLAELERTASDIDALQPRAGELEGLDRERRLLQSAGRVAELLDGIGRCLSDGEDTAGGLAAAAARQAEELADIDASIEDEARRLRGAAVELQDLAEGFQQYRRRNDFDPGRLEELEERRAAIERLCLAHGVDEAGLAGLRDEVEVELGRLRNIGEGLRAAEAAVAEKEDLYVQAARALGRARRSSARKLATAVEKQLASLALEKASFDVRFSPSRGIALDVRGEDPVTLHPHGAERTEFLLAANPGEPSRPLHQVASGGELSRVMLALHVVADAESGSRAMVFDEVDTGVGGAVADAVGARLARLARGRQVLCVTHLPQVAAHGDTHFRVEKSVTSGRTATTVTALAPSERVEELARMLGGKQPTDASRKHAAELVQAAARVTPPRKRARTRRGA